MAGGGADLERAELVRALDLAGRPAQLLHAVGRSLRREGEPVPAVPVGHGPPERRTGVAADHDPRSTGPDGTRVGVHTTEVDEGAVVLDRPRLRPDGAHGGQMVVGAGAT